MKPLTTDKGSLPAVLENGPYRAGFEKQVTASTMSEIKDVKNNTWRIPALKVPGCEDKPGKLNSKERRGQRSKKINDTLGRRY